MKAFFLVMALLVAPVLAQYSECDTAYDSCIQSCCSQCGSTLSTNSAGDLVCNVGTADNPDQACIDACIPCSNDYQECVSQSDYSYSHDSGGAASCGAPIALVIGVFGAMAIFRRK
jgi:hypothetical protein